MFSRLFIWSTLQYRSCDAQTQFAAEQIRAAYEECVCSCLYLSVNSVYSFLHCFPYPCSSHGVPKPVNKVDISSSGLDYSSILSLSVGFLDRSRCTMHRPCNENEILDHNTTSAYRSAQDRDADRRPERSLLCYIHTSRSHNCRLREQTMVVFIPVFFIMQRNRRKPITALSRSNTRLIRVFLGNSFCDKEYRPKYAVSSLPCTLEACLQTRLPPQAIVPSAMACVGLHPHWRATSHCCPSLAPDRLTKHCIVSPLTLHMGWYVRKSSLPSAKRMTLDP
jgi:hypothetical protein